ncbi:MAG: hypothetical protein DI636_02825 [Pelagerythrobacter marensis]|uniref:hypothetical protein n=1 Tax=Qipengyuania sp. YIM B01966 TaxID=2778646 RepID=UPI000DB40BBD|nr:hypothetical protein [Qipengyuania sp. YIM B01966]PZO71719.1 MAG: hypothetical protein DI636_02825 [Pelagerythrobacter marensis]PZU18093.1 MAG: hypothetical protein DI591_02055 [Citromicrobium sp.]
MEVLADHFRFASDAEWAAITAGAMFLIAGFASWAERRRTRRAAIDRVGMVPWTGIFLTSAVIGAALLALAIAGFAAPA